MISGHYVFVLSGFLKIPFDFLSFRLIILNIFLNINHQKIVFPFLVPLTNINLRNKVINCRSFM